VKLFLLGRQGGVTHWLEDAAQAFAADGHEVSAGFVRRPWIPIAAERRMAPAMGQALARRIAAAAPDLILAIGALHVPRPVLEPIAALASRPPLAGWVGDAFDAAARTVADLYDVVGYTDSALVARRVELGLRAAGLFLPHAADPSGAWPQAAERSEAMVFVANPTPHRRAVVAGIETPMDLYGPGWRRGLDGPHQMHPRRSPPSALRRLYGAHRAALNIRNELNVVAGLNQRSFDPALAGAVILSDDQPDLPLCFEPGREVAVWTDSASLNALYERTRRDHAWAAEVAERGRRRVLAEHTYANRLRTLRLMLDI
jgi:spore maturation protein CgeB